jgi:hypothetical protein
MIGPGSLAIQAFSSLACMPDGMFHCHSYMDGFSGFLMMIFKSRLSAHMLLSKAFS